MIVCQCHAVNDAHLAAVCAAGADSLEKIGERCGAGTDCGSCISRLESVLCSVDAPSATERDLASVA